MVASGNNLDCTLHAVLTVYTRNKAACVWCCQVLVAIISSDERLARLLLLSLSTTGGEAS